MSLFEKEVERKNILEILILTRKAIKTDDVLLLKELSNRTVHSSSIYKDPDAIAIAVTIYALAKIIERKRYTIYPGWSRFFAQVSKSIDRAIESVKKRNTKAFRNCMFDIRKAANSLTGHLKIYIQEIFRKARISKASRIYEHGISRAETCKLLGITQWELSEYIGRTGIGDVNLSVTMPIKQRIKMALGLFGR